MSKKNQNYTNRKQNRFQPERMRGNVFANNNGKRWMPGENGRAAKVERLLKGAKEEKKEIAGNMAGYKDSGVEWIGAIPETWKISRMGNIATYINGYAFKPKDWSDDGKMIVRIQDLTGSSNCPNHYNGLLPSKYLIQKDDILISWAATLDSFLWNKEDAWLNQHIFKVEHNKNVVNKHFMFWLSKVAMQNMSKEKRGIMMEHVKIDAFSKYKIPLPPLPEQQRIADFLDTKCGILDRTIDAVSRQIEDLEKYKKALITKTVTKGICKKDEPERAMKDSGVEWIGEVPEEWSVKRLKYVLDSIRNGASAASYEYEPDSFRYVRITDIDDNGNLKQTGKQYLPKEMAKNFILNKKAVLIANTGSLGKAMLFDPDKEDEVCALNGHLIEAIANPNIISNEYLYFFIKSYNYINWVNRSYVQTTMQMLSAGRHKNLPVTVPPLAEQQQIADYLDEKCKNIDNRVQKRRQQLEWLKEYKKSLIFDYVTGKKRIEE